MTPSANCILEEGGKKETERGAPSEVRIFAGRRSRGRGVEGPRVGGRGWCEGGTPKPAGEKKKRNIFDLGEKWKMTEKLILLAFCIPLNPAPRGQSGKWSKS